jgi:hypothetical protein
MWKKGRGVRLVSEHWMSLPACAALLLAVGLAGCGSAANGPGGGGGGGGAQSGISSSASAMGGSAPTSTAATSAGGGVKPNPTTTLPFDTWVDITPQDVHKEEWITPGFGCSQPGDTTPTTICTYGAGSVTFDFQAPGGGVDTYVTSNMLGLWRQASTGEWTVLGDPSGPRAPEKTTYVPQTFDLKVDPADSQHLYLTSGVQGPQHGFYVSHDRGATWTMPPGFVSLSNTVGTNDVTVMDVDPADFAHILISFHSGWSTTTKYSSGIAESRDGGATWVPHLPAGEPWSPGTKTVFFLHDLRSGQGDGDTWLVGDEQAGFWRTEDAGKNWKQVSTLNAVHGGPGHYYAATGTLYVGAFGTPVRSTDNGKTFKDIPMLGTRYYFAITGDGERLYTRPWDSVGPYMVSPETDGLSWEPLVAGPKDPTGDTFYLSFDPVNRVLYSGNHVLGSAPGGGGVWALHLK